jgi:hypothetical protein
VVVGLALTLLFVLAVADFLSSEPGRPSEPTSSVESSGKDRPT